MAIILAFAGSNSSKSINLKLVKYTAQQLNGHDVKVLNMVDYPLPMYSEDIEKENGFSPELTDLKNGIQNADAIVISVNEHNSNISAFFKNLIDWLSRLDRDFIRNKKVFLMSTSPGKRGAISAHESTNKLLSRFGAKIVCVFSLPSFYDNFDEDKGILNDDLSKQHKEAVATFNTKI